MSPRRMPRPSAQEALSRQLDSMQTLSRPASSSSIPTGTFSPTARGDLRASRGRPALFDRAVGLAYGTGSGICLHYVPVPLSEQVTADGRFVPPDAYTVDGTNIEWLDHPAAPQIGETVVVSYSHTGVTADSSCRFRDWQDVDMILYGVNPTEVWTKGECNHRYQAVSAQNWPNSAYYVTPLTLSFKPAGRGRFSAFMVGDDLQLGPSYSGGGGPISSAHFNPDGQVLGGESTSSTLSISSFAHYWGNYIIDEDGEPYIPENGEYSGWAIESMIHLRGTDIAYGYQSRRFRSGTWLEYYTFRTLWDMGGDFPSLIWEESDPSIGSGSNSVTELYDLGGYLLERIEPYGSDNHVWRLSSFNGSSLTTIDELVVDDGYTLLQVWGGPRLMIFSDSPNHSADHSYYLYSYGPGGLSLIRTDPDPGYDPDNLDVNTLYHLNARTNTTDTDWAWHPATGGIGMGSSWIPIKLIVNPEYDIVPYRQISQYDLECPQGRFPGDDINPVPDSAFQWNYLASHVNASGQWQMAASGKSNKSVGVGVRTSSDRAWRLGFRGVVVPTYLNWAFLEFDRDHWDFGILRNDRGRFYLVNLAKDRP